MAFWSLLNVYATDVSYRNCNESPEITTLYNLYAFHIPIPAGALLRREEQADIGDFLDMEDPLYEDLRPGRRDHPRDQRLEFSDDLFLGKGVLRITLGVFIRCGKLPPVLFRTICTRAGHLRG